MSGFEYDYLEGEDALSTEFIEGHEEWEELEDISHFDLQALGNSLWKCKRLKKLNAYDLHWTELDPLIGGLTQLTELSLCGNFLSQLPEELMRLTHLEKLFLNSNRLSVLPATFGTNFPKLELLNLNENLLTELPAGLNSLTNLTKFFLSDNPRLTHLPRLAALSKLVEISLDIETFQSPPSSQLRELELNRSGGAQRLVAWFSTQPASPANLHGLQELISEIMQHTLKLPRLNALVESGVEMADLLPLAGKPYRTPLAFACLADNLVAASLLLKEGADINQVMPDGKTALWVTMLNEQHDGSEMVRFLLSEGADPVFKF